MQEEPVGAKERLSAESVRRRCEMTIAKVRLFSRYMTTGVNKLRYFMMQECVSRQELREMRVGQTRIFTLADKKKIMSARVQAYQLKNEENLEFEVKADYSSASVCITRTK